MLENQLRIISVSPGVKQVILCILLSSLLQSSQFTPHDHVRHNSLRALRDLLDNTLRTVVGPKTMAPLWKTQHRIYFFIILILLAVSAVCEVNLRVLLWIVFLVAYRRVACSFITRIEPHQSLVSGKRTIGLVLSLAEVVSPTVMFLILLFFLPVLVDSNRKPIFDERLKIFAGIGVVGVEPVVAHLHAVLGMV